MMPVTNIAIDNLEITRLNRIIVQLRERIEQLEHAYQGNIIGYELYRMNCMIRSLSTGLEDKKIQEINLIDAVARAKLNEISQQKENYYTLLQNKTNKNKLLLLFDEETITLDYDHIICGYARNLNKFIKAITDIIEFDNAEAMNEDIEDSINYNEEIHGYEIITRIEIDDFIYGFHSYETE